MPPMRLDSFSSGSDDVLSLRDPSLPLHHKQEAYRLLDMKYVRKIM